MSSPCLERPQLRNPVQAAIFDMDGVLIDSHPVHREAWKEFLHGVGREISDRELDFILDGRKRSDILRHFLGDIPDAELEKHGRRKDELFQQIASKIQPVPGVLRLLEKLQDKGVRTAVATSAAGIRARSTLTRLRLMRWFGVVITGDDVTEGKPDPAIYQMACARLGVEPDTAFAVEDAVSGVLAAKSAGLRCVAVSSHKSDEKLRAAGADYVIPDFGEDSLSRLQTFLLE
jgi:beta-phosphoglucomutase